MSSPPDTLMVIKEGLGHCSHHSPWLHVVGISGQRYELFLERGKCLRAIKDVTWQISGGWYRANERAVKANKEATEKPSTETGSDGYKIRRLEGFLLKQGEIYRSISFRSLESDTRDFLLAEVHLEEDEVPGFAFYENDETWFAATSRKIIWSRPGFKHALRYDQIKSIQSETEKLIPPEGSDNIIERLEEWLEQVRLIKSSSPWLYFIDCEGAHHDVLLPPGGMLFAAWNAVLFMMRLERIHPSKKAEQNK